MNAPDARAHILVVDSDRLVLTLVAKGLRDAGYRVTEAADARTALGAVDGAPPDLALLEIPLDLIAGTALARSLTNLDVPFIVFSAYSDLATIERMRDLGAVAYLIKPVDVSQIIPQIDTSLARAAEMRAMKQTVKNLNHALDTSRETSIAIGILMERRRVDSDEAFETLRSLARSRRCRVQEVAGEIVAALGMLDNAQRHQAALTGSSRSKTP